MLVQRVIRHPLAAPLLSEKRIEHLLLGGRMLGELLRELLDGPLARSVGARAERLVAAEQLADVPVILLQDRDDVRLRARCCSLGAWRRSAGGTSACATCARVRRSLRLRWHADLRVCLRCVSSCASVRSSSRHGWTRPASSRSSRPAPSTCPSSSSPRTAS